MLKKIPGIANIRWTIRLKLMVIISTIIVGALSFIIGLATYFFKQDNEVRIKENISKLTEVITLKVNSDLGSMISNYRVIASAFSKGKSASLKKSIFDSDKNLLFLGKYSADDGFTSPKISIVNTDFLAKLGKSEEDLVKITKKYAKSFKNATGNSTVFENVSPAIGVPVAALAFSLQGSEGSGIMLAYFKMDQFLSAFRTSGIVETFMVNGDRVVVAHPDQKVVLAGIQLQDLPIVKVMEVSPIDNGLTLFKDKDGKHFIGAFKKLGSGGLGIVSTVLEDKVYEEVYNIQRRNIYLMLAILNLSIFFVFFFAQGLTKPILRLVDAAGEIEKGHFKIHLMASSSDEIGVLTESFASMSKGLDAFGRFVNKEIAESAMKGRLKLGGDRKEVAIFFSDIRNFTSISERLEPEEVVEFLNAYMTDMVHCIHETGGTVDKYIGDAIMAVWGAIGEVENPTAAAINASLLMRTALLEFNQGRGGVKKPIIKIGCGINFGPVVAGQIGSESNMAYTVIGDAVNLASRVESLNKTFGTDILVTQNALDQVKGMYSVEKMQSISVKGKSAPQTIYCILGKAGDKDAPANLKELRKLVGIDFDPAKK